MTNEDNTRQIVERARQDERGRIARDLHDDVVHQLTFLVIDVDLLRQGTGTCHPDTMRERLEGVLARVQAIGTSVRNVAHRLKTTDVDDLELDPHAAVRQAEHRARGVLHDAIGRDQARRVLARHILEQLERALQERGGASRISMLRHEGAEALAYGRVIGPRLHVGGRRVFRYPQPARVDD